jgi:multicomponent K+:H+ antiporter subunit E
VTTFHKLVPSPLLSCGLLGLWLALSRSIGLWPVFVGLALGLGLPLMTARLRPTAARVRRPLAAARFVLIVAHDVVVSNFHVAWAVLSWRWRPPASRFVIIPLELRAPSGLAALAMVTTIVPGTVWSELALDCTAVMLHVWDVGDDGDEVFIARFKARYEKPLREIFE